MEKVNVKDFFKKLDYRHYICLGITLGFIACSVFVFPDAFKRILEAFRDFGLSIAYYLTELFGFQGLITPSVNAFSDVPFTMAFNLPKSWEEFTVLWNNYWQAFIDENNFFDYISFCTKICLNGTRIITVILAPLVLVVYLMFTRLMNNQNNDWNVDSKPLKIAKTFSDKVYRKIKLWIINFFNFVKEHKYYYLLWLTIWCYNFNLITIILEAVAFYCYFVISFDVINIYRQMYKLFFDLSPMINFIPIPIWIILALVIFNIRRKKRGYDNLNHMELRNRGFINERPIVSLVCATMGRGKTTMLTDMALSMDVMIRDKAYEIILENDLAFPYFPWINFEKSILRAINNGSIYNLHTARRFIRSKKRKFNCRPNSYNLFMYDYKRYGLTYNNGLYVADIWEILENYVQAYMIYIMSSSYIQSNYSIRTDVLIEDCGNFPLWDTDFFKRDSKLIDSHSRHSHILNQDALRLGKRLCNNNDSDYFEFGIVAITEIGKDRGNNLELQEVKKKSEETNQKNDLFNAWLKLTRHSSTVDNYPFVKVFADEQRPESWGADARDLCEIIHIDNNSEVQLAMPLFFIEEIIHSIFTNIFLRLYKKYRFVRGDNTLFMYVIKTLYSKFHQYYVRTYNTFGFKVLDISVESGTQDGNLSAKKYYIMSKKIYSKRFSTDAYSEFFEKKVSKSNIGLNDVPEFENHKATFEEMKSMNSYFFNDLMKIGISISENKKGSSKKEKKKSSKVSIKKENSAPEKWMQFVNMKK